MHTDLENQLAVENACMSDSVTHRVSVRGIGLTYSELRPVSHILATTALLHQQGTSATALMLALGDDTAR